MCKARSSCGSCVPRHSGYNDVTETTYRSSDEESEGMSHHHPSCIIAHASMTLKSNKSKISAEVLVIA
jgi:hypothetical protein